MGLETVGIMCSHMCLQIISTGKGSRTGGTPVFLARIVFGFIVNSSKGARVRDGRLDGQLGVDVGRRHSGGSVVPKIEASIIVD